MKIVSKEEMRNYPRGTVFMEYRAEQGIELGQVEVKDDYIFGATSLIPDEDGELFDYDWNLEEYKDSDRFYIFEQAEVLRMIKLLMRGIGSEI